MERRNFLKAAPIAIAGIALPAATEACLTDPPLTGGAMIIPEKWGEPVDPNRVIRVEITPVGPFPVIEMVGPIVTNAKSLFEDVPWERIEHCGDYYDQKEILAFLKKESAVFCVPSQGSQSEDEAWLCYGVMQLLLYRNSEGNMSIRAISCPDSTMQNVEGLYMSRYCYFADPPRRYPPRRF